MVSSNGELLEPGCKRTRTEITHDDDFTRHAALMESMTRAPAEEPILRWWKDKAELLRDAFTDEALRRMARKAGVESATQTGALAVNDELRYLALRIMDNLCDEPGDGGVFPSCGSHRQERGARGARAKRGIVAQKEINHENQ